MKNDEIVEEVWKIREQILEEANYDIKKVIENIKAIESTHVEKLITGPLKKTHKATK